MKNTYFLTSACRYCRHYEPEGRRGGTCQKLGVQVQSEWKACVLALPPFATTWENLEEIVLLEHSLALKCSSGVSSIENLEEEMGIAHCPPQHSESDRIFLNQTTDKVTRSIK
jgi:hypothetical protein